MRSEQIHVTLCANGHRVADQKDCTVDAAVGADGRAIAIAQMHPIELQVAVVFDPPELAAIHARKTYGFKALRAMLDALPQCVGSTHPPSRPATRRLVMKSPLPGQRQVRLACDECAAAVGAEQQPEQTELPSAAAVRHVESYVREWETAKEVPKGDR